MKLAIVYSRALLGVEAPSVRVEVHLTGSTQPRFNIVGLPEAVVKESKDRVRSAIMNSHFYFPSRYRITVNLAPADLPKEGGRFDLAIALGILIASGQLRTDALSDTEFAGELALSGELRPIKGILSFAIAVRAANRALVLPAANVNEASLVSELKCIEARDLLQVCAHLSGKEVLTPYCHHTITYEKLTNCDLSEVKGQAQAKRVLEIAAAGSHNLLMIGPPGAGKTMLASRLPSILPLMTEQEALSVAALYSLLPQGFDSQLWRQRPFRAPHHTASAVALVGGGQTPHPGEISLAHQGVLFLDELPEFGRHVLESLREPLEAGVVRIARATYQVKYPAQFQLVAAMNPCPCGYASDATHQCCCTQEQIQRYHHKISGPFRDRIDMILELAALRPQFLLSSQTPEQTSAAVRERVVKARERQLTRAGKANAYLNNRELDEYCALRETDRNALEKAIEQLALSMRSYHRVLKLARTIADLAEREAIEERDLWEALSYQRFKAKIN